MSFKKLLPVNTKHIYRSFEMRTNFDKNQLSKYYKVQYKNDNEISIDMEKSLKIVITGNIIKSEMNYLSDGLKEMGRKSIK